MLTLTFLGVGDAFAKRNFQSNALIEAWSGSPDAQAGPDEILLLDFGTSGPLALHALKDLPAFAYLRRDARINYPRIGHVFVTHLHADHVGGLEELALMNTFVFARGGGAPAHRPRIISSAEILSALWEHSLKGGLSVMRERDATLEDYFVPFALTPGDPARNAFDIGGRYRFNVFPTDHLRIGNRRWPSLGLHARDLVTGQTAFYSGDTRFLPGEYGAMMEAARIAFHEVYLGDKDPGVHTMLAQLRTLGAGVKRKTWLYHYGDDWDSGAYEAPIRNFAGLARPFQRYVLFE